MSPESTVSAIASAKQQLVLEFAGHWMRAYEQGFKPAECTDYAFDLTHLIVSHPLASEISKRAFAIIRGSGIVN